MQLLKLAGQRSAELAHQTSERAALGAGVIAAVGWVAAFADVAHNLVDDALVFVATGHNPGVIIDQVGELGLKASALGAAAFAGAVVAEQITSRIQRTPS